MYIAVPDGCALWQETDQLLRLWKTMRLEIKDELESLVEDKENRPYFVVCTGEGRKDPSAHTIVVLCSGL